MSAQNDDIEEHLFHITEDSYGPTYKSHLIEIYKLYVEMADRVSSRRQAANSFYLTVNTAIIGAATFFQVSTGLVGLWLVAVAGAALCLMWIRNIQSYKDLNSGKFHVINKIETRLPIAPYDVEWEVLQRGKTKSIYRPFHTVERYVPQIFIVLYLCIIVLSVDWARIWNTIASAVGIC
jgi:hypothetical protein